MAYVVLEEGTADLAQYKDADGVEYPNVYTIGKSATFKGTLAGISVDIDMGAGNITFVADGMGASGNRCYISDGFNYSFTKKSGYRYYADGTSRCC